MCICNNRFANLLPLLRFNDEQIWNAIKKVKSKRSTEIQWCETSATNRHFYVESVIQSQVEEIQNELNINSSTVISKNITKIQLKTAAEMFLYLNGCDGNLNPWFKLFTDLLLKESPDQIVLTFNRIINSPKSSDMKYIATKVFKRITEKFSLQYFQVQNISIPKSILKGN